MGYLQFRRVNCFVSIQQKVQIYFSGSLREGFFAAHAGFDDTQGAEQIQGVEFSLRFENHVQKPFLIEVIHRLGFINIGDAANVDAGFWKQAKRLVRFASRSPTLVPSAMGR